MAISLAVTGSSILGLEFTVTDADQGDRFSIIRTDNEGYYDTVAVRGADLAVPTGDVVVVTDYEAPFNANLTYTAQAFSLSDLVNPIGTDTEVVTTASNVPDGFAMIHQVFNADERVAGTVTKDGLTTWTRDAVVLSENKVLGRSLPVLITEPMGPRKGSIKMLNLLSFTTDYDGDGVRVVGSTELKKWKTIFDAGATMMFRSAVKDSGFFDIYFKVLSVEIDRSIGGSLYFGQSTSFPLASWTVDYQEVDRPLTSIAGLGLTNWQDVYNNNATWAEVDTDHSSWQSVLSNPTL